MKSKKANIQYPKRNIQGTRGQNRRQKTESRRANRATPWRATEEEPDAFHLEGGRLALRSRFGEVWSPAAGENKMNDSLTVPKASCVAASLCDALAQPPGSAAGLPFEAASAKNGYRPPNKQGEYPIFNKEYPRNKGSKQKTEFRRANRATPWRATEEEPDAFHLEGGRLALRSRFGEVWSPAAGENM